MAIWQAEPVPHGEHPDVVVVPSVFRKSNSRSSTMTRADESPRYDTSSSVVVGVTAAAAPPPVTEPAKPSAEPVTDVARRWRGRDRLGAAAQPRVWSSAAAVMEEVNLMMMMLMMVRMIKVCFVCKTKSV